jgi:LPS-assembly lipoprotein
MILRPRASLCFIAVSSLVAGCGFHLRKEVQLPAAMQRVHIAIADPASPLAKDLAKALPRSGAVVVDTAGAGVAVLNIAVNTLSTDVLSVGGTARANEYALRYHVEFSVTGEDGSPVLAKQTIELSREFTFDASQALGVAAETDLLGKELERDMVQTILRRLEALGKVDH